MDLNPQIEELLSLEAVRTRAHAVLRAAEQGRLNHFNYHADRMEEATNYVLNLIKVGHMKPIAHWQFGTSQDRQANLSISATLVLTNITSFRPMAVGNISRSAGFPA